MKRFLITGISMMAVLAIGTSSATAAAAPNEHDRRGDLVDRAIAAPFTEVGIESIDDAMAFWQARVTERPEDYLSRTKLASTILAQARETGDLSLYPKAEGVLREALAVNPTDEGALLALSGARAANHDFAGSMAIAYDVLTRNPQSQAAKAVVADDEFELGNYAEAERALDALAAKLRGSSALAGRRAKLAAINGDSDAAVRYAAQALLGAADLDLRPSEAAFYRFQLGYFLYQAGDAPRALEAVDAGLAIDPDHLASLELRAKALVSLRRLQQAAKLYEDLVQRTPAADLHGELAKVYDALGRDTDAKVQIAQGLELGRVSLSRFPAERRHLAGFFAEFDPPIALEAATADFSTRHDIGAYDTLAWAEYVNGDYDAAAEHLSGARATGARSAPLLYHAGMIEWKTGHAPRARALLRDALRLDPNFDLAQAPIARATLAKLDRAS